MIYRKDTALSFKRKFSTWLNAILLIVVVFELGFILFGSSGDFWEMKFVDVANVIAQFATAGAFLLGFHQYRHARKQERQLIWAAECKVILSKMIDALGDVTVGADTSMYNLKKAIAVLGTLAIDFDEGFKSLDEGDHKATLRMHWQDMYFNKFLSVMQALNLGPLLPGGECGAGYLKALNDATKKVKGANYISVFEDYFVFREVLMDNRIGLAAPLIKKLEMYFFVLFFFDKEHTDDYMYGNMVSLDMRGRAPLLAAIYDLQA